MSTQAIPNFPLPHATRQQVFTALFNFLKQTIPPVGKSWNTFSQSLVLWDQVSAAQQPALYLHRGPQTATQKDANGVTKWLWRCSIWVYYRVDGLRTTNTYPDQLTDQFLDDLERLFQTYPNMAGRLTLGGLVHHCWIDGGIYTENGINDNQAFLIVPVSILL